MKEHPIIFSGPMVRAILEGRKTQTRRVVKLPGRMEVAALATPDEWNAGRADSRMRTWHDWNDESKARYHLVRLGTGGVAGIPCPYGIPGDRLWVRETWCQPTTQHLNLTHPARAHQVLYAADDGRERHENLMNWYQRNRDFKWRPSIHMPRWASRITLEVTGVQVQRLREISDQDAKAEGCPGEFWKDGTMTLSPIAQFLRLWDSLNGKKPGHDWASNPWVWVIGFRVVKE